MLLTRGRRLRQAGYAAPRRLAVSVWAYGVSDGPPAVHQRDIMRMEVGLPVDLTPEERPAAVLEISRGNWRRCPMGPAIRRSRGND